MTSQPALVRDVVKRPNKWIIRAAIAIVVASYSAGTFGSIFFADFVNNHPALLIALSPQDRNLVLVSEQLSDFEYYGIAFARLTLTAIPYFFLGRWFSDKAMELAARSKSMRTMLAEGETSFRRSSYFFVFFVAFFPFWMLSGALLVKFRLFFAVHVAGVVARLAFYRWVGEAASSPLEKVREFIGDYKYPIIVISIIYVGYTLYREFRKDDSHLRMLGDLAHEAENENGSGDTDNNDLATLIWSTLLMVRLTASTILTVPTT